MDSRQPRRTSSNALPDRRYPQFVDRGHLDERDPVRSSYDRTLHRRLRDGQESGRWRDRRAASRVRYTNLYSSTAARTVMHCDPERVMQIFAARLVRAIPVRVYRRSANRRRRAANARRKETRYEYSTRQAVRNLVLPQNGFAPLMDARCGSSELRKLTACRDPGRCGRSGAPSYHSRPGDG